MHSDLSGQPNSHTQGTLALHASSEASLSCFQECSSWGVATSVPLSWVLQSSPQTWCLFSVQIRFCSYSQQSLKTFPELIRIGLAWPGASFWTWPGHLFPNPMSHVWPILVSVPWLWQNIWSKPRKKGSECLSLKACSLTSQALFVFLWLSCASQWGQRAKEAAYLIVPAKERQWGREEIGPRIPFQTLSRKPSFPLKPIPSLTQQHYGCETRHSVQPWIPLPGMTTELPGH